MPLPLLVTRVFSCHFLACKYGLATGGAGHGWPVRVLLSPVLGLLSCGRDTLAACLSWQSRMGMPVNEYIQYAGRCLCLHILVGVSVMTPAGIGLLVMLLSGLKLCLAFLILRQQQMLSVEHGVCELCYPVAENHHALCRCQHKVELYVPVSVYEIVYVGV